MLVFLAACAGSDATMTTVVPASAPPAAEPGERLTEFLTDLRNSRFDSIADLADERHVALFAALESNDAGLLEPGRRLDSQVTRNFWGSFVAAVPGLGGDGQMQLSEPSLFEVGGDQFASVELTVEGEDGVGTWVLRSSGSDGWVVDPIASFGGPFLTPLVQWLRESSGAEQSLVADAVAAHRSSFEALALRQRDDEPGVAIGLALEELFGAAGVDRSSEG